MSDGIFLLRDGELEELSTQPFATEDAFQELLAKYPALLAGGRSMPDVADRWLLVRREMGVPDQDSGSDRWAVDHLFLDQEGVPTLVEVKRGTDPRIRRELVGQMLDYAANAVVYWPAELIRSRFTARCEAEGINPEGALAEFLGDKADPDTFWTTVKTNLQAGKVRMLFVADIVPPELRRIVEFLNVQMDPAEVLALEIKQYAAGAQRTLVCNLIGQTAGAETKKGTRTWDEETFFASTDARSSLPVAAAIRRLYDWARTNHAIAWGKGQRNGSFGVRDRQSGTAVLWVYDNGQITFPLSNLGRLPPFDHAEKRREFLSQVNAIPGVAIPDDVAFTDWPSFLLGKLPMPEDGAQRLIEMFSLVLGEIASTRA